MSEKTRLTKRIRDGLIHCAPAGKEPGGCGGCPYMRQGCACEDREMLALPADMVADIRDLVDRMTISNG